MAQAPKKKVSTKAPVKKKAPAKAPVRRVSVKKAAPEYESFKAATDPQAFMSYKPSRQTAYWIIIAVLVIGIAAWAMTVQLQILAIYNQIESNTQDITVLKHPKPTVSPDMNH